MLYLLFLQTVQAKALIKFKQLPQLIIMAIRLPS
jgi:hypothetical protein